jgi:hypothetical protein
MKFDNLAGSSGIGTNIYKLELGYEGPKAPYDEEIIQHTFINGGIGLVDLGTRQEKFAEFHVILLNKDQVLQLESFLNDNIGNRIKVTEDFDDERIFMENFSTTDVPYYASILEIGNYAEDTFSEKRGTFQLRIKLGQPVTDAGLPFNPPNTGNLNVLIEVNTAQYDFIAADTSEPDPALATPGDRWYDTTSNNIRELSGANLYFDPSETLLYNPRSDGTAIITPTLTAGFFDSYEFTIGDAIELVQTPAGAFKNDVYKIVGTANWFGETGLLLESNNASTKQEILIFSEVPWKKVLYPAPADIPSLNFINGVFYWSAFFDMTIANYGAVDLDEDFLAGFINNKSLKIPGSSVEINKGPSLMRREGFSFSVRNNDKFWEQIISGGIPLFGAKVTLKIFRQIGSAQTFTKIISGTNITNSFSYTDYTFQIEPLLLNQDQTLPTTRIEQATERYKDVRKDAQGDAPYLTYGQFDVAALQDVSKVRQDLTIESWPGSYNMAWPLSFPSTPTSNITGSIDPTDGSVVWINNTQISSSAVASIGYRFFDEQIDNVNGNGGFTLKVAYDSQTVQDNVGNVMDIESITLIGDFYKVQLKSAFSELPTLDGSNPPGSEELLRFVITNATYQLQFNEDNSGGFGSINAAGGYVADRLRLYYLADNNKDLIEIPANEFFVQQPSKNSVRLNIIVVNTPSKATNFLNLGSVTAEAFGTTSPLQSLGFQIIAGIQFQEADGSPLVPPPLFVGPDYEKCILGPEAPIIVIGIGSALSHSSYVYTGYAYAPAGLTARVAYWKQDEAWRVDKNNPAFWDAVNDKRNSHSREIWERLRWGWENGANIADVYADNSKVTAFKLPITQYPEVNANIDDGSTVVLGLKMRIQILQEMNVRGKEFVDGESPSFSTKHFINEGIRIIMRVRLQDNTFVHNSDWEHDIPREAMGTGTATGNVLVSSPHDNMGVLWLDNLPGDAAGTKFLPGVSTPTSNYDYDVDFSFSTLSILNAQLNATITKKKFWRGARILILTPTPAIYEIIQNPASPFIYETSSVESSIAQDKIVRERRFSTVGESFSTVGNLKMWKQDSGVMEDISFSGKDIDFFPEATLSGQDLFDVSELFEGPTQLWPQVVALEFELVGKDTGNYYTQVAFDFNLDNVYTRDAQFVDHRVKLEDGPFLYKIDTEFKVADRPMFSAMQGKNTRTLKSISAAFPNTLIGTDDTFPSSAHGVTADIMETMFPGKTPALPLQQFMTKSNRESWQFRRQFIKDMPAKKVMEELMHNLWAVLTLNEDDEFVFVSLNEEDHAITSPNQEFDDSNILKDSILKPKFRKTDEIYQKFDLKHDMYQLSEFSSSVPKWRKGTLMADSVLSEADPQLKWAMGSSTRLYNVQNIYEQGYAYHYFDEDLPMRDWIVKHFVFNSWTIKLSGSIDRILGPDGLKIMDYVTLNSFFHTNGETSSGFITKIDTDVYTASCIFTIFIPRPLGYLGPLCDPFNDAWQTARNSSNFPINDAGNAGRTTGSYTQKDAGTSPRGPIEC